MPIREEFHWRNFGLTHFRSDVFFTSQWYWPPVIFIIYRFIVAGYIVGWLMYGAVALSGSASALALYAWPVYLTNWSYFMLAAHLLVALVVTCVHTAEQGNPCCRRDYAGDIEIPDRDDYTPNITSTEVDDDEVLIRQPQSLPWYMKFSWILFNIAAVAAFLVTIVYWTFLFPMIKYDFSGLSFITDFHLHAVNTIVILLELIIAAMPVRLMHFIFPLIYGILYATFSLIFWADDNSRVIYPKILDWNTPGTTVLVILLLAFVGIPIFQLILYGLYRLRIAMFRSVYRRR